MTGRSTPIFAILLAVVRRKSWNVQGSNDHVQARNLPVGNFTPGLSSGQSSDSHLGEHVPLPRAARGITALPAWPVTPCLSQIKPKAQAP
jgi:hypothetical protein